MRENYWYITPEDYEAAAKNGISRHLILSRLRRGWDLERAYTEKVKK